MTRTSATVSSQAGRLVDTPWPGTAEARVAQLLRAGEGVVLLTIVSSQGSAPRHAGTRAVQTGHGFEGTVGGGILEAQAMQAARQCLADGRSRRMAFVLNASSPRDDMVCGGSMEVFCEVFSPDQADLFARADAALAAGEGGLWTVTCRDWQGPPTYLARLERHLHVGDPGLEPGRTLLEQVGGRPGLVTGGAEGDVYVEPLAAPPVLLLCGGGHVSLEVARLAHACGFVVDVAEDREEFANATRFPMARRCHVLPGFGGLVAACGLGPGHFVAIMTRGHAFDREVLEQVLTVRTRYVGMIGSRSKREHVYAALRATGVSAAALAGVYCPIGLAIRAESPQQIAVAVVAELLAARGGVLDALRQREPVVVPQERAGESANA